MSALRLVGERLGQSFALPFLILMLALIVGPRLAARVRLPSTVGFVLAGMLVGPHCAGLLKGNEIALQAWGTFGLLYLMFSAALELDVRLVSQMKLCVIVFALLSFLIPLSFGVVSARTLGYGWAGAILMGSNWGSHTLVAYPMLRTLGLDRNRAVATVVGATAITDTCALLVLTGVSVSARKAGNVGAQGVGIVLGLTLLMLWTLIVLPRIAHWFFAKVGGERSYRVVFGLVAFLSGAVLAEAAAIDGIIGAFLAGLGMARVIPKESRLMDSVQFLGATLFIPTFLVSVGVLLEPRVLIHPKTLFIAAVFTIAVLGGKALAAAVAGRVFHFTWAEVGVMSGLSGSQAAATLATTLIGSHLGIFNTQTVNAVLIVVLVSLIVTPAMVSHFAKSVTHKGARSALLGSKVLVPMLDEKTRPMLSAAARIAGIDGGMVVAARIATEDSSPSDLATQRRLADEDVEWLAQKGFESREVFRVSSTFEAGLRDTILAEAVTLVVLEWRQPRATAEITPTVVARSPVPVLLIHGAIDDPFERLVVLVPSDVVTSDLVVAKSIAQHFRSGHAVVYVGAPMASLTSLFVPKVHEHVIEQSDPLGWLKQNASSSDVVLLAGLGAARDALDRIVAFTDRRFIVACAGAPAPSPRPRLSLSTNASTRRNHGSADHA